jgi:hypothetical protein
MNIPTATDHKMPSHEISYAYAAAMHFAQQLEINLRAFLYTGDYHGFIDIPLSDEQLERYKTSDTFIDKATCGLLLEKLRAVTTIKDKRAWKAFDRACEHRNRLAHSFLTEHDFDHLSAEDERAIIKDLHAMSADTYGALLMSRIIRDRIEKDSDADYESLKQTMAVLGVPEYENRKRRYVHPRKRKAVSPRKRLANR